MKIEKITENKIRIILKQEDFKDKSIDIKELLLTTPESQHLFLEILNRAKKEVNFDTDGYKLLIEAFFQLAINRGKDPEKFLVGGGDIFLFASMSMLLSTFGMMIMLFFACLFSLIASKIIKKSLIHFAPFIQIGLLIALFF